MANCFVCHKGTLKGYRVSHSDIKTRRFFKPNLHDLRVKFADEEIKKVNLCSKCYKKIKRDFLDGKKINFVPLSLLNQKRITVTSQTPNGKEKGTAN